MGHVFFTENTYRGIWFYDPQTGNADVENYFRLNLVNGETYLLRTDNREMTDRIEDCCKNRRG